MLTHRAHPPYLTRKRNRDQRMVGKQERHRDAARWCPARAAAYGQSWIASSLVRHHAYLSRLEKRLTATSSITCFGSSL
jgi:hypothetical protein